VKTIPYSVISISKSEKRLNNIKNIENCFGYKKESIRFYNSKIETDVKEFKELFPNFNIKDYAKNRSGGPQSRPFNRALGEAGVWMSHMAAWRHIVDNDLEHMIVFEDDCIVIRDQVETFFEKIACNDFEVYCVGQYGEAFYIKNSGARKMLDACMEEFYKCPLDEGIYNMHKSKKIYSNGISSYRVADEGIKANLDIIFTQSYHYHTPNSNQFMDSEISDTGLKENSF
jgi:hypothetical protein